MEIAGVGIALPRTAVSNQELIERYDLYELHGTTPQKIVDLSGIETRYLAEEETLGILATWAALEAIKDAGIRKGTEIGKVLLGTATGHTYWPIGGTHLEIQARVTEAGFPVLDSDEVVRACASFTHQLIAGYHQIGSGWFDNALVVGAETLSRAVDFRDKNTGIIFGDGAGAFLLGQTDRPAGLLGFHTGTDGSKRHQAYQRPIRLDEEGEIIDGGMLEMPDNRGLFRDSVDALVVGAQKALERAELEIDEIDVVVPHQANLRIIDMARRRLGIPEEKVVVTVDRYGNTSSASKPIAFYHAKKEGLIRPGKKVMFSDVGVGISTVTAIVEV